MLAFATIALGTTILTLIRKQQKKDKIKVGVIGCGSMGSATIRRLQSFPEIFEVFAWNRTFEKAKALVHSSGALKDVSKLVEKSEIILIFLGNLEIAKNVVSSIPTSLFQDKHVICLVSSNPTQAFTFATYIQKDRDLQTYVDGAYAGAPSTVLDGSGLIMVSSSCSTPPPLCVQKTLESIGKVEWINGKMGCAKAIDYAIVDMYFANLTFFLNGLGMIEAEGVSSESLLRLLSYKLPTYTTLFREQIERLDRRDYKSSITATLRTWLAFFDGRIEWLKNRKLNTRTIDFARKLLIDSGANHNFKKLEDAYRVQEILRFNNNNGHLQ